MNRSQGAAEDPPAAGGGVRPGHPDAAAERPRPHGLRQKRQRPRAAVPRGRFCGQLHRAQVRKIDLLAPKIEITENDLALLGKDQGENS